MAVSIEQGNKLIAEFLGKRYGKDDGERGYLFPINGAFNRRLMPSQMQYHSSWYWLMPVVEKIESLGYWVTIMPYQCQIYKAKGNFCDEMIIDSDFSNTRLENTFDGVIGFIEWYNNQKQTP